MPHYSHLVARMIWRQVIGRTSILGGGGWFGLVWNRISSISSNHPGAKSLVRQGIDSIPSPNQQRRPFPSLLSDSSSMPWTLCVQCIRSGPIFGLKKPVYSPHHCAHRVRWGGTNESTSSAKLSKLPLYRYSGGITKDWDPSLKHPDLILQ